MSKIVGIDLGTTNSVVGIMDGGKPVVISNSEGKRTTPSVVAFTKEGEVLVGDAARRQMITNPDQTVFSAKRFIGLLFSDCVSEAEIMPYKVVRAKNGSCAFSLNGTEYTPQEIAAKILAKLADAANDFTGQKISDAVITVPAYFSDAQRQATKDAGTIAGLNVRRIINEPTAAAMAYGLEKNEEEKIIVYDFGGGTFDVSVLEVGDNVVEVKATGGDTHLGGDNIDEILILFLSEEFKKDTGIDISRDAMAMQRLREASEKAKIELSTAQATDINLPFLTADQDGPRHLNTAITRAQFEQMIESLVDKTLEPCKNILSDASIEISDIDQVVLVGGSTRIPLVQAKVKALFGKEPNKTVNPDEVVCLGAAIQGGVLGGEVKEMLLLDVTPLTLGIATAGDVMTQIIERNTTIPHRKSQVFSTYADNQPAVTVSVLQGERPMANDNVKLAEFNLANIPAAPRGVPQIEVSFDIDANGILSVSAKDLGTGQEQSVTITSSTKLDKTEIDRMVADAEAHKEEDNKRKELVKERNELDTLIFSLEKTLNDNSEAIDETQIATGRETIAAARESLESQDSTFDQIVAAKQRVESIAHDLAQSLYEKKGSEATEQKPQGSAGFKEDDTSVIDADLVN